MSSYYRVNQFSSVCSRFSPGFSGTRSRGFRSRLFALERTTGALRGFEFFSAASAALASSAWRALSARASKSALAASRSAKPKGRVSKSSTPKEAPSRGTVLSRISLVFFLGAEAGGET